MCVRFSNAGNELAVGCCSDKTFTVRIYDAESGALRCDLRPPHASVVYDVQWSRDDRHVITASADGTSRVWRVSDGEGEEGAAAAGQAPLPRLVATLQHRPPIYVYCVALPWMEEEEDDEAAAKKQPPQLPVITGGYDGGLRLWDGLKGKELGLVGGQVFHDSHVNTVVVDRRNGRLYSGDGIGVVIVWKRLDGGGRGGYGVLHRIINPDLDGKPITSLAVHPTRRKGQLLVLAQGNVLRLIDLYTYRCVHAGYSHVSAATSRIRAAFSPDGRYVVAGSEDGRLRAWEAQSGRSVLAHNSPARALGFTEPLVDVAWHPRQHVLAMAAYGENMPVLLYYSEKGDGDDEEEAAAAAETGEEEAGSRRASGADARRPLDATAAAKEDSRMMARLAELKAKWMTSTSSPAPPESKGAGEEKGEEKGGAAGAAEK